MGSAGEQLGKTLTRYLGAGALLAFAKSAITEFAKVERSINSLAIQMKNLGAGGAPELAAVRKELEAIAKAGDGALTLTIPAFQTFLGLTKDVQVSLRLVRLATNIAESGLVDLSGAVNTLESAISGLISGRQLKNLGINLKEEVADGAVDAGEALKLLFERFPDQISNIEDTQDKLDRLAAAWDRVKLATAEALVDSWDAGARNLFLFKEGAREVAGWFSSIASSVKNIFVDLQSPFPIDTATLKKQQDELDAQRAAAEKKKQQEAEAEKARLAEEEAIRIAAAEAERKRQAEAAERAKKIAEVETEIERKLLEAKIATAEEGSQARLELEMELLEQQEAASVAAARKVGASTLAIHEAFALARLAKEMDFQRRQQQLQEEQNEAARQWSEEGTERWEQWLEDIETAFEEAREANLTNQRELLETQLADLEEHNEEWLGMELERLETLRLAEVEEARKKGADVTKIEEKFRIQRLKAQERHNRATLANERETRAASAALVAEWSYAVTTAYAAIFGENKALAIAQAIIDTWAAATAALKALPNPIAYAMAASAIATGLANVARIRATKKEKGRGEAFDDPVNDEKAFTFGRKSVEDFIEHTNRGHQEALRKTLPTLATREGRHAAVDRAEIMKVFGDRGERRLATDIRELVTIIRTNIREGDPTGGIPPQVLTRQDRTQARGQAERQARRRADREAPAAAARQPEVFTQESTDPARRAQESEGAGTLRSIERLGERAVAATGARAAQRIEASQQVLVERFREVLGGAPVGAAPPARPGERELGEDLAGPGATVIREGDVHIHGNLYGGDSGMRELSRKLERATRLDRTRRMR